MGSIEGTALRLLYLGFAFPPGVAGLYPGINPAGHALETQLVAELRKCFEIRSVGLLPISPPSLEAADPCSGIAHDILLVERPPELWHRVKSLVQLKAEYCAWLRRGWSPDLVLVYNLSPVYNQFLLWLRRQPNCPKLVLLLLDSPNLGRQLPWLKRFRHRFKPLHVPDTEMLSHFDACVGLSRSTEPYFASRSVPFLWMPGGCIPARAVFDRAAEPPADQRRPLRLGYYGALGAHAGVRRMIDVFLKCGLEATLEICGYGKAAEEIQELAGTHQKLIFHGLITPDQCLRFGSRCDVLVNPRPPSHGNENNFASKLFDYALSGSAILTSRISGCDSVLGPAAYYFDPQHFETSLAEEFSRLAATPRPELARRGAAVQHKILREFSWAKQGHRLADFLERTVLGREAILVPAAAELAA